MALQAEVLMEFDGSEWRVEGGTEFLDQRIEGDGVCFSVGAAVKMKRIEDQLERLGEVQPYWVRLALSGQEGKGAKLEPQGAGRVDPSHLIIVTCDPRGVDIGVVELGNPMDFGLVESGRMGVDLEGLDGFIKVVRQGVNLAMGEGAYPVVVLNVRSETSWGQMVRVAQIVHGAGCHSGLVRIDDDFPGLDIVVKMDPEVLPPIVERIEPEKRGLIVIKVEAEGLLSEDGKDLSDDAAFGAFVEAEKRRLEAEAKQPVLRIVGERDLIFRRSHEIIRRAAKFGIDRAVFGGVDAEAEAAEDEVQIEERPHDIPMALPKPKGDDAGVVIELRIRISADGSILIGDPLENVGDDPGVRELPRLAAELRRYRDLGGGNLRATIEAESETRQQRVVDVLNALAAEEITSVVISDIKGKEPDGE
ncbi:MAG: hypothetical protein AAGB14_00065 [Verrucomicrobiota bacterium]